MSFFLHLPLFFPQFLFGVFAVSLRVELLLNVLPIESESPLGAVFLLDLSISVLFTGLGAVILLRSPFYRM